MFEDSLIESGNKLKTKRGVTTFVSFLFQMGLLSLLVLLPLLFADALPKAQLMTALMAPRHHHRLHRHQPQRPLRS